MLAITDGSSFNVNSSFIISDLADTAAIGADAAAPGKLLRGALAEGLLVQVSPQIVVAYDLLQTMAGRIAAIRPLIPSGNTVTGAAAEWIYTGRGTPYPIHVLTRSRRHYPQLVSHLISKRKSHHAVIIHGVSIALPQQIFTGTNGYRLTNSHSR